MVAERTAALAELNRRSRQTERLAALGTLAAGLGHDLANLLLPIRTRLEVLEALDLPPQAREDIAATRSALSYIQRLSTGLRLMSADPEQRASAADHTQLSMWWQDVEGVLRTVLPRNVVLESDIPPDLSAAVPRHHLTQTVFNLVQNAGEAIAATPKGSGTVRVGARRQIVPMGGVSAHDNGSVESVEIAVSDNGPGMTPDVFARCFEPYFSTKGRAISTGMGLALVRGLVERAGGTVRVDSSQEKGTTFSLILPAAPAAPAAQAPKNSLLAVVSAMNGSRPGRTEALAAALLEALGVVVRRAPGPEGADIWVAGSPESSLVATFLGERPGRCVVLCDEAPPEPFAESWERVTFVGRQPKAADLRRALAWAVSRASRVASGWSSERHGSMVGAQGGERGDNA
jgi:nitrogen-specific signal transduction histidine kinase